MSHNYAIALAIKESHKTFNRGKKLQWGFGLIIFKDRQKTRIYQPNLQQISKLGKSELIKYFIECF
jgi:hypothetical protein